MKNNNYNHSICAVCRVAILQNPTLKIKSFYGFNKSMEKQLKKNSYLNHFEWEERGYSKLLKLIPKVTCIQRVPYKILYRAAELFIIYNDNVRTKT